LLQDIFRRHSNNSGGIAAPDAAAPPAATCNTCCATRAVAVVPAGEEVLVEEKSRGAATGHDRTQLAWLQTGAATKAVAATSKLGQICWVRCGSDRGMAHYLHACLLFSIKMHRANFVGKHATATDRLPFVTHVRGSSSRSTAKQRK